MSSPQAAAEAVSICTECGYQQTVILTAEGRPRACQNCASKLRFQAEVQCPHCRQRVAWSSGIRRCPKCEGRFAPGIPLAPRVPRSLSHALAGALDAAKAEQREYRERDAQRRSEGLYRNWAAMSRDERASEMESGQTAQRSEVKGGVQQANWYGKGALWLGLSSVLLLLAWGGVAAWRSVTKKAIEEQLSGLSAAARRADGRAASGFYGATLVRYQKSFDVPHEKVASTVTQMFREYPFVLAYDYKNPQFESIMPGEVSLLVDQQWELRGNELYSGAERHRLIWRKEGGGWRIVSDELIKTHWSRKTKSAVDALAGTAAIGVRQ